MLHFPVGIDDFRMLRSVGGEYVDKTHLIRELLDKPATQILLLPRPRRFGKTLNLSMLRYYFERPPAGEDRAPLFEGLSIWGAGERYRAHFGRYPVISISFKGVKQDSAEACLAAMRHKLQLLYQEHRALLDDGALLDEERLIFRAILEGRAEESQYGTALLQLSKYLHRQSGQPVVLLFDEYDEPIHAAYLCGYEDKLLPFYRTLLTEALKGNPHLFKGILTGILRVARESIFSGLNNPGVYTLLRSEFATCFGFTEQEVVRLLEKMGQPELLTPIRAWYNGYLFGGVTIYNPWSLMCFLDSQDKELRAYWLGTSSNDLVREQLVRRALELQPDLEDLMAGGSIERPLEEHTPLGELASSQGVLWSLLVFSGYLKAEKFSRGPMEGPGYRLSIPNREVREVYRQTFQGWLDRHLGGTGGGVERLKRALFTGDEEALGEQLQRFVTDVLSYHDTPAMQAEPEQVYHGFVAGLLASLEPEYQVRSNREAGAGRPDVQILPARAGLPGVAMKLKVARPKKKSPEKALAEGLAQIRARGYTAELEARGATPIHCFAVALRGKQVWVRKAPRRRAQSGGAR
jgi:hypothetical protein